MLRTESLVYSGSGRNIFSATYTPAAVVLPKTPPARPTAPVYTAPTVYEPPPPPPINLKFFGTATRANGERQAFLLSGEDVYLAAQGDIVARKYKIVNIAPAQHPGGRSDEPQYPDAAAAGELGSALRLDLSG